MKRSTQLDALVDAAQELLDGLSDLNAPGLKELRGSVANAIASARGTVKDVNAARLGRYVNSVDDYITNFPRIAFATALLIGGVVAFFVAGSSSSEK